MRKLASVKRIDKIEPIEGADNIELVHIGGWKVVVAKNVGHQEGNLVVYCEIDSFLPIEPEFEFLRKSSYKKLVDGTEGFRLKTIRLRGQISQGLVIPLEDAVNIIKRNRGEVYYEMIVEGKDLTDLLDITKYEPPIPANLSGKVKGNFPGFISKTDEERCQNLTNEIKQWSIDRDKHQFYVTEKLDGSSFTCYLKDGEFGVCSRNLELQKDEDNTLWKTAISLKLEEKLRTYGKDIALQGELIGEGIQKNPYKIKGHTIRFFNVFDIKEYKKVDYNTFHEIMEKLELQTVPVTVVPGFKLFDNTDDLLKFAEGKSVLNEQTEREGVVIRSKDNSISFKAISNTFLTK